MIRAIAFDLDDTLIDTSGILVPEASRQAFEVMKPLALNCQFAEFNQERKNLSQTFPHSEIFQLLAEKWVTQNHSLIPKLSQLAVTAFYNPQVPDKLPLMAGALSSLQSLQNYSLYLVTSGSAATQIKKIDACGVRQFFKKVLLVDRSRGERKKNAFNEIIAAEKILPDELLCLGNRLTQEIRDGKLCGAQTCFFAHGEHINEKAEVPEDHPDFTIYRHEDFKKTCRL